MFARRLLTALLVIGTAGALYADDKAPAAAVPVSAAEMKIQAEGIKTQVDGDYREILRLQSVARKKKDVIKLNCVNDKLVQIKAQMNLRDTNLSKLEGSLGDAAVARPLFSDLQGIGAQSKLLREEAVACIGEVELLKTDRVEVSHPDIIDDPGVIDPYSVPEVSVVMDPPGYASPFN